MNRTFILSFLFTIIFSLSACQSRLWRENAQEFTTAIGGLAGGASGYYLGKELGNSYAQTAMIAGGALLGGYIGNQLGSYLEEQDRETHILTTNKALTTGRDQSWRNVNSRTSGRSEIVQSDIQRKSVSVPVLKNKVKNVPPLDFIGESYRAIKVSKIRGGPSTEYKKVGSLKIGDVVNVVGKVQGKNWYMISQQGVGSGFIYADLLKPSPTAMLADHQTPTSIEEQVEIKNVEASMTCRTVKQTITLEDGSEKEEVIKACQGSNGWEVIT